MKTDFKDSDKVFWKSIPLSLIRDERLTYTSRAVAIHLLSMGPQWKFNATGLHKVLRYRSKTSEHLGRDLTKKIIKELEVNGYLVRSKTRLETGIWHWTTTFHPLSGIPHLDEKFSKKTSYKEAGINGQSVDGQSVDGKRVDKSSLKGEFLKKKTQPLKSPCNRTIEQSTSVNNQQNETTDEHKSESVELDLSHPMLRHYQSIFRKVSMNFSQSVSPSVHQQIADEFSGVLRQIQAGNHGEIQSKRAWIIALFKSAQQDEFLPEFGSAIAKNRETQKLNHQGTNNMHLQSEPPIKTPEAKAKQKEHLDKIKKLMKPNNDKRA